MPETAGKASFVCAYSLGLLFARKQADYRQMGAAGAATDCFPGKPDDLMVRVLCLH
jgi:hypothetical protein